jgi:hypothetical protein
MSQEAIEDAVWQWVVTTSGYPVERVIWAEQNGERPDGDIITLHMGPLVPVGLDALEESVDLSRPAGEEVELKVVGVRSFSVTLQAYTHATTGSTSGRAVLGVVQTRTSLPSVRGALALAGVSLYDMGTVQVVPEIVGADFEGRAVLEVQAYCGDTASEFTTYIETTEIEGDLSGQIDTFTVTGDE